MCRISPIGLGLLTQDSFPSVSAPGACVFARRFDRYYQLVWAVGRQLTDTVVARIYHANLQDLKRIGLEGIISCQSFRVFHPSGLAMSALAECLWTPDVP